MDYSFANTGLQLPSLRRAQIAPQPETPTERELRFELQRQRAEFMDHLYEYQARIKEAISD